MTTAVEPHAPSRRCYQLGCHRPECERASYRYAKQLKLDHARGQYRLSDATQVRVHIERLLAADWTTAQISRAAQLSHSTVSEVRAGRPAVSKRTALAIFNIPIGPPTEPQPVDATGSIRRLRALMCIGHSLPLIAPHTGMSAAYLWLIIKGQRYSELSPHTAQAITRAYRKLATAPGISPKARAHARRNNWHGPLAWDDIDDPAAQPETDQPYKPVAKNGRDSMRRAEIKHLLDLGESVAAIASRMNANEKYISDLISQGLDVPTYAAAA